MKTKMIFNNFFLGILLLFLNACATKTTNTAVLDKNTFVFSGKVLQTSSYCGGAKPTQEILDNAAKPKVYPDKKFYIKEGKINDVNKKVVAEFVTTADGTFSVNLKPGIYSILLEEQLTEINIKNYQTTKQTIDEKCAIEWWKKPYSILEINNENVSNVEFLFHHKCFIKSDIPCITYKGPLPQ